jgi:hypothetical protein
LDVRFETSTQDLETNYAYGADGSLFSPDGHGDQAIAVGHPVGQTTIRGLVDGEEVSSLSISVAPDVPTLVYLFPRFTQ